MSQDHIEDHDSLIKTPKQLVITVVLAFVIPIAVILLIVKAVTVGIDTSANNPVMADEAIAKRRQAPRPTHRGRSPSVLAAIPPQ